MGRYRLLLVSLALGMSTACGIHQHKNLGFSADHGEIISKATLPEPLPGRFAHVGLDVTILGEAGSPDPSDEINEAYVFPTEAFDRSLASVLREVGAFDGVYLLAQGEGGNDGELDEGFPDDGLILQVELYNHRLEFVERNSNVVWGVALWVAGIGIPPLFFHDSEFHLSFYATAQIVDAATNEVYQRIELDQCEAQQTLSLAERTDTIWPYFICWIMPCTLIPSSADAVVESLLPVALGDSLQKLMYSFDEIARSIPHNGVRFMDDGLAKVKIEMRSPRLGQVVDPLGADLDFDVVLPRATGDLLSVRINGVIAYEAPRGGERTPPEDRVTIQEDSVPFDRGRIEIIVHTLYGQPESMVIWNPRSASGRPLRR